MEDFDEWWGLVELAADAAGFGHFLQGLTDQNREDYFEKFPDDPDAALEDIVQAAGG